MRPRWLDPAILVVYTVLVGLMLSRHAMWLDEMQAWLIARDAPDISTLFRNLRYEGHPALWYLLLWPLSRVSRDPVMMQALHLAIASASVALVLWRAPLLIVERLLFPFGYFFIYEYAVKSRSYALGCLLLFIVCAIWRWRHTQPMLLALVLALMANVHILFAILAIAALLALVAERIFDKSSGQKSASLAHALLSAGVAVGGIALAAATCIPPPDGGFAEGWLFSLDSTRLMWVRGALNAVLIQSYSLLSAVTAIGIFVLAAARWRRSPAAAVFLLAAVVGLLAFFYVKYPGAIWHHGVIFAALFAAVWISRETSGGVTNAREGLLPPVVFIAVLVCQVYTGFRAVRDDWRQPLSNGREVAAFIAAKGWATDPMVVVPDKFAVSIIGYLGRDRAYYPNGRRWGSFTVWDKARLGAVDVDQAIADVAAASMPIVWIMDVEIDRQIGPTLKARGFVPEASFTGARFKENHIVYRRGSR